MFGAQPSVAETFQQTVASNPTRQLAPILSCPVIADLTVEQTAEELTHCRIARVARIADPRFGQGQALRHARRRGVERLSLLGQQKPAGVAMEEGVRFAVREGGRTVGSGVVTKIVE